MQLSTVCAGVCWCKAWVKQNQTCTRHYSIVYYSSDYCGRLDYYASTADYYSSDCSRISANYLISFIATTRSTSDYSSGYVRGSGPSYASARTLPVQTTPHVLLTTLFPRARGPLWPSSLRAQRPSSPIERAVLPTSTAQ